MTVIQLIQKLSRLNPYAEVYLEDLEFGHSLAADPILLDEDDYEGHLEDDPESDFVVITSGDRP